MILDTNNMIQDVLVFFYPDTLFDQPFLKHVIISLHLYDSKFYLLL